MRTNIRTTSRNYTHEGARAKAIRPEQALRRSVLSCLLWEDTFYEDGVSIAERIQELASQCDAQFVADLAVEARTKYKLRHDPLWLLTNLIGRQAGRLVGDAIYRTIQRPDELGELVSMYWANGKRPLSAQLKLGLARAFRKFDAYQLAKYDRDGDQVKLRDVMFLVHPKPKDEAQAAVWQQFADGKLGLPDTWESNLVRGADKKETFTRLLQERKLGYMALLRNLRKMTEVGVDYNLIVDALKRGAGRSRVLPFRFLAAVKAAPTFAHVLDEAMMASVDGMPRLRGHTKLLVDVSWSMQDPLSGKSDMNRIEAACMLAVLLAGVSERLDIYSFSNYVQHVPSFRGMALASHIVQSQPNRGTWLGKAVKEMDTWSYDRLIVITDEQSHDPVPDPKGRGYLINTASYQHGIGYHGWTHLDGFSEAVVTFIQAIEAEGV